MTFSGNCVKGCSTHMHTCNFFLCIVNNIIRLLKIAIYKKTTKYMFRTIILVTQWDNRKTHNIYGNVYRSHKKLLDTFCFPVGGGWLTSITIDIHCTHTFLLVVFYSFNISIFLLFSVFIINHYFKFSLWENK